MSDDEDDDPRKEYFALFRNGNLYASHWTRDYLIGIIRRNPDFTERENGRIPVAEIIRYEAVEATNYN